jgi:exodeoxyribonuclease V alpha subunit
LLAALLEQRGGHPSGCAHLAIGLAAPTGKAAARMAEAIRNAKAELPVSEAIKAALPDEARTLHRLLGSRGDSPHVRHNAANPLALDVLVVDEASMVDLALMAKLLDALPPTARLILLGDKDQLCAVEAGAVFAELCEGQGFDAQAAADLQRITGQQVPVSQPSSRLGDAVVLLTHSHRFAGDSGIGELARRINGGDVSGTLNLLKQDRSDLTWNAQPSPNDLLERLDQGYAPFITAVKRADPAAAFNAFNAFRALTAQREGPWGVAGINDALEARIKRRSQVASRERWYVGRPVMVRQNDYALGLFNGDIGICLHTEFGLRVFFAGEGAGEDGFRSFAPARLPSHDSAFAMTVHKSQGSEFAEVLLVLPEQPSPLLTRSLFYTGITRAKHKVEIWALPARLGEAVATRAERAAGLAERLTCAARIGRLDAPEQGNEQLGLFN